MNTFKVCKEICPQYKHTISTKKGAVNQQHRSIRAKYGHKMLLFILILISDHGFSHEYLSIISILQEK